MFPYRPSDFFATSLPILAPVTTLATSPILLQGHVTALATSRILLQGHVTALATSMTLRQDHVAALATSQQDHVTALACTVRNTSVAMDITILAPATPNATFVRGRPRNGQEYCRCLSVALIM